MMKLDREDRAALARLGVYAGLLALLLAALLVGALGLGLAVHLFRLMAGV